MGVFGIDLGNRSALSRTEPAATEILEGDFQARDAGIVFVPVSYPFMPLATFSTFRWYISRLPPGITYCCSSLSALLFLKERPHHHKYSVGFFSPNLVVPSGPGIRKTCLEVRASDTSKTKHISKIFKAFKSALAYGHLQRSSLGSGMPFSIKESCTPSQIFSPCTCHGDIVPKLGVG